MLLDNLTERVVVMEDTLEGVINTTLTHTTAIVDAELAIDNGNVFGINTRTQLIIIYICSRPVYQAIYTIYLFIFQVLDDMEDYEANLTTLHNRVEMNSRDIENLTADAEQGD